MFIAGDDLKDEEGDNDFDVTTTMIVTPIDLNSNLLFTKCYFNPITLW